MFHSHFSRKYFFWQTIHNSSITSSSHHSISNSPQKLANAEAFAMTYLFLSICLGKKTNAGAIEFLGILKEYSSMNKKIYNFVQNRNVLLNKKVIFTGWSTDVCILFSYFCCSFMSVSKKQAIERKLTFPYYYIWQKFNKMNDFTVSFLLSQKS